MEVKRLEDLKTSKLTELVLRKQKEFQEISKKSHITLDSHTDIEKTISSFESGEHSIHFLTLATYNGS